MGRIVNGTNGLVIFLTALFILRVLTAIRGLCMQSFGLVLLIIFRVFCGAQYLRCFRVFAFSCDFIIFYIFTY